MSDSSTEDVHDRGAAGLRRTSRRRESELPEGMLLLVYDSCESPRYDAVSLRLYVADPEVIVSSALNPFVGVRPVVVVPVYPLPVSVVSVYDGAVREPEPVYDVRLPAEKNASSLSPESRLAPPLITRRPGGGLSTTSRPSRGPLDIVTGPAAPSTGPISIPTIPSMPTPNARARLIAPANSSSRSVRLVVRRSDDERLGAITRGSPPWCRYVPSLESPLSSAARRCVLLERLEKVLEKVFVAVSVPA